jgi:hypothetical protein
VNQQILLLYKRIYAQKPNNGFFSIHLVHVATLWCQHDININFAEHAAKITLNHINKARSNPWKITLLTLRAHIQAMLTNLAGFEAHILIGSTRQPHWSKLRRPLKRMVGQGKILQQSWMLQHEFPNPLTCWNLGDGNNYPTYPTAPCHPTHATNSNLTGNSCFPGIRRSCCFIMYNIEVTQMKSLCGRERSSSASSSGSHIHIFLST